MKKSEDHLIIHDIKALPKELEYAKTMDEVKALLERSKALMSMRHITPEDLQ